MVRPPAKIIKSSTNTDWINWIALVAWIDCLWSRGTNSCLLSVELSDNFLSTCVLGQYTAINNRNCKTLVVKQYSKPDTSAKFVH